MIIHIVRNNETINEILDNYHLTIDDLKANNLHVTDFRSIQPGIKLKIPFLSEENKQILKNTEPFIQDYYPTVEKYGYETKEQIKEEININNTKEKNNTEAKPIKGIRYVNLPPNYNNRYYNYPPYYKKMR